MTEAEWLGCNEPEAMLAFCRDKAQDTRRGRLLAVACCRLVWGSLCEWNRETVEAAERYADALTVEDLQRIHYPLMGSPDDADRLVFQARTSPVDERRLIRHFAKLYSPTADAALDAAVGLVREVYGNPFRPVAFSPSWGSDTAVTLARQMYESRDFSAMAILADALQDAGCDSEDILAHCRGEGPHVRGCWVVDLILGKE